MSTSGDQSVCIVGGTGEHDAVGRRAGKDGDGEAVAASKTGDVEHVGA